VDSDRPAPMRSADQPGMKVGVVFRAWVGRVAGGLTPGFGLGLGGVPPGFSMAAGGMSTLPTPAGPQPENAQIARLNPNNRQGLCRHTAVRSLFRATRKPPSISPGEFVGDPGPALPTWRAAQCAAHPCNPGGASISLGVTDLDHLPPSAPKPISPGEESQPAGSNRHAARFASERCRRRHAAPRIISPPRPIRARPDGSGTELALIVSEWEYNSEPLPPLPE
jgi:hypothetical protein